MTTEHVNLSQTYYFLKLARNLVIPRSEIGSSRLPEEDKNLAATFLKDPAMRFFTSVLFSNGQRPSLEIQTGVVFFMAYVDKVDDFLDEGQYKAGSGVAITDLVAQRQLKENPNITFDQLRGKVLSFFPPDKQQIIIEFLQAMNSYHDSHHLLANGEYGYDQAYAYHQETTIPYVLINISVLPEPINQRQRINYIQGGMAGKFIDDALDCLSDKGMNMLLGLARDKGELELFEEARKRRTCHKLKDLMLIKQTLVKAHLTRKEYIAKYREAIKPITGIPHQILFNALGAIVL